MSYKYSTGSVRQGDIYFEDDRTGAQTYIDFDQDTITLRPSGSAILHAQHNKVGIGTSNPLVALDINGGLRVQSDSIAIDNSKTPAHAGANGQAGQICWDANYLYVCVATNTWKRVALSSW